MQLLLNKYTDLDLYNWSPDHLTGGILTSAVKRLKYLIAINRIYVIVNSKLIAINRTFLSILNVPLFIYFIFCLFIFILMPLSTWKSVSACFMQMFYFIENQHYQTGRFNKIIKCTFQVNKDSAYSAVKPWLNIFFFSSLLGTSETMNRNS